MWGAEKGSSRSLYLDQADTIVYTERGEILCRFQDTDDEAENYFVMVSPIAPVMGANTCDTDMMSVRPPIALVMGANSNSITIAGPCPPRLTPAGAGARGDGDSSTPHCRGNGAQYRHVSQI
ncbi:MAG: hypothetical protein AUJ92_09765 [Armatimonadetes bacterium CG2_30_59_28]|nr:MAG: hypothetical protein AUJ92_09765 [Armatimonadetes bacterium CG2_30_59_28]PIU61865.1 MAG: hypothetical protein COS85_20085 [Armatimonadetes bacterium CG07_land_8_20_14_0_80_59_28]